MKILKYQAGNMRQALAQIKDELGKDAMVVSTRDIRYGLLGKGVEVSVAIEVDEDNVAESASPKSRYAQNSEGAGFTLGESDIERIMAPLRSELRSLRSLLRSGSDGRQGEELRREMMAMRRAFEGMHMRSPEVDLVSLVQDTPITAPSQARIITLVGPTGVGKTTTIAKLAANAVYCEYKSTAIVTLDTYRVGGEEQMRTYAELIGAPLFVVADPRQLNEQILALSEYDKIYIDTAGRSPRDVPAIRSLRSALDGIEDMEVHLTMALTTTTEVIDANFRRYQKVGVNRLLFTKLDESLAFSELVRAPARLEVPISFVTTGQAVPEDIVNASKENLMEFVNSGMDAVNTPRMEAA